MKRRGLAVLISCAAPALLGQQPSSRPALKEEAVKEVDKLETLTQQMIDEIFSFSELGFQEFETSRYVTGILEKNGFRIEREVAGIPTAWVASYGSGKPVLAFITDLDCIPRASQRPGVAYHDPLVEGAPGHGEGHNSGMAVNVTAALVLKKLMDEHRISGTIEIFPGVAEELLGTKAFYVRAGLFRDVDLVLGAHVGMAPWEGRSALDAVELMDTGWDFRREHLRPAQRSHRVILNGGDQPNVVPSEAAVWYYFRELDYQHIKELYDVGNSIADAAAKMTGTTVDHKLVGSAWPPFFNKVIAEAQQQNIAAVGMPKWNDADQMLAKSLQKEIGAKVEGLKEKIEPLSEPEKNLTGGVSDDVGDISWNVPMTYLMYPANIPNLPGHSWPDAVAMATPIAHKGSTAGAKVQALTALDLLLQPQLVQQAWEYFQNVQTKDIHYRSLLSPEDKPAIEMNKERMEKFLPQLKKFYYNPARYKSYLEQLGIRYPTVKTQP